MSRPIFWFAWNVKSCFLGNTCIRIVFSKEKWFDISHKLSLIKTICMKCQILFFIKNKKTVSVCCLLNLPRKWLKLTLSILGKSFSWGHIEIFSFYYYFSQKTDFDISCKCLQWRQLAKSGTDITCKCLFHLSGTGKLTMSVKHPQPG